MGRRTAAISRALRSTAAEWTSHPLLLSASSLMLNVVLSSFTGVVFWIVAARVFTSEAVGRDSALISSMIIVAAVCQLNLGSAIIRFLPITKMSPSGAVLRAYAVAAGTSAAGGLAFVLAAPKLAHSYRFLSGHAELSALYVAAVSVWSVFALEDSVLTAVRRAPWVTVENAAYGAARIALLPAILVLGASDGVFVAWAVPLFICVVVVNVLLFTRVMPAHSSARGMPSPIERFGRHGIASFMAQDYVASILFVGSTTFLPVLVVALRGSVDGAHFYMPLMVVSTFDLLFGNVTRSLTVEGAMADRDIPLLVWMTIVRFRWMVVGGILVLIAVARPLLLLFGSAYASTGVSVLRLLACASVFRAVIALYSAICRLEGRAERVLATQAAVFVLTVGLTILLGRTGGLQRVALAWLIANCLTALATTPHAWRIYCEGRAAAAARTTDPHEQAGETFAEKKR